MKPWTHGLFRPLLVVALTIFAAFAACAWGGVRLNWTMSLPVGLYRISTAADADLVDFCPAEPFAHISVARQYRHPGNCPDGGNPLLKPVVAKSGDVVVYSATGLRVNGILFRNTAPRARDSNGRPLPHYPFGTYRVEAGTVWVASTYHPLSFDSRYFGPISTAIIRDRLKPLFTL